jgi:predicted Zn-dependent protease
LSSPPWSAPARPPPLLPVAGRWWAASQAQLDQLGAQAFAETKQKEKISTDGRQNGYVQCVVNALVAQLPPQYRGVRWETAVFVDKEPNAFALPGGKVGVNTGIFTVAKNQDQLAADRP